MFEIVEQPIDAAAVTAAVADPHTGATVTFIGTTRDHNDGRTVTRLEYEAYPEMAVAEMRKIGDEAKRRWPIARIAIVHRIGVVPIWKKEHFDGGEVWIGSQRGQPFPGGSKAPDG